MPAPRLDTPTLPLPDPSATWEEGRPPTPGGPDTDLRPMAQASPGVFGGGSPLTADSSARVTVLPRVALAGPASPLPRFTVAEQLGRGGMGEVEAATDNDIGRLVAIKRRRPGLEDAEGLARFADEIRTVGRLEHPNIVPIHDVGLDELGRHYFVMKHVEGETLYAILRRLKAGDPETHARFPMEERVRIFRGVLDAVAFAHDRGVLHRDLKPANIMVGGHGEVTVLDWGLARPLDPAAPEPAGGGAPTASVGSGDRITDTRRGQVLGTPAYMSPEQARGEPLDARSDVYALSVILHELLGLRHYLDGLDDPEEIIEAVRVREPDLFFLKKHPSQPRVPMDLLWYVKAGLAKEPARRFPSVRAMLDRLDARADGRIPIQCPITFTQRVGHEIARIAAWNPTVTLAAWALTAVGLLASLVWVGGR
ncbi:MAG: serine/threonine-protein kinase [Pseudomonadota bacterium]